LLIKKFKIKKKRSPKKNKETTLYSSLERKEKGGGDKKINKAKL